MACGCNGFKASTVSTVSCAGSVNAVQAAKSKQVNPIGKYCGCNKVQVQYHPHKYNMCLPPGTTQVLKEECKVTWYY